MVALVFWIACTRAAVARAAIFIVCDVFKMRERRHGQMKNEIMNGNQGDHVTFVWSWRRSKQGLSFCRTFHPFIQHHDADALHRRTLRSPDVTLLTQAGWYGLSGFEFPVAGQLCVQNVSHACLFAKCTIHLTPQHIGLLTPCGSALAQVMACCLTARSHYLNQCWLIITLGQFHKRCLDRQSLKTLEKLHI